MDLIDDADRELELPPEGHPLHKLGARLTELLDEDQWASCERLLLEGWAHDAIDRKTGANWRRPATENSMRQFTDQSRATRVEKAKRVLQSLANGHDYKYFYNDGYPRHAELQQDAAAALEVLNDLSSALPAA